jgi:hypothetical protein
VSDFLLSQEQSLHLLLDRDDTLLTTRFGDHPFRSKQRSPEFRRICLSSSPLGLRAIFSVRQEQKVSKLLVISCLTHVPLLHPAMLTVLAFRIRHPLQI